jgi:dienelactone hydrolase
VDNRETLFHLASWGFVALCPEVFPEPYPGDERALFETLRFAVDRKANLSPRLRTSALGIAGYSLGGGRVVRGLASLAAVSDSGSTPESMSPINPESCDDAACVAKSVRAAVSLQGWNEGRGGAFATPLLLLGSDDDAVVTRWRDGMARVFDSATGEKILGVVRGGGHNLGPHYFFGWMTAFLRGELYGDADAKEAVFGTDDARSLAPFGEHPNVLTAHRRFLGIDRPGAGKVETFEFENTGSECVAMIPDMSC